MIFLHPTVIICISVLLMAIFHNRQNIFSRIAIITPIITIISILTKALYIDHNPEILFNVQIFNLALSYNIIPWLPICCAFSIVLFAANLYAIGQNKKREIILGNSYAASAFLALLGSDFISIFLGMELMMVFASWIIFYGGIRSSIRSSMKYFITHLVSGSLILIGFVHLIHKNNSLEVISVTELLNDVNYHSVPLFFMLIGMLINIASFPFSGWMVNYYNKATPSGFLYLISFTTKVSIIIIAKFFLGYKALQYIGAIMIIYASIKSLFEDNMFSLLCYLSIISMGIMLFGISYGLTWVVVNYLAIHIIYKLLLSIIVATIIDNTAIHDCSELKKLSSKPMIISLIIGIAVMFNFPLFSFFLLKLNILNMVSNKIIYLVILLGSFMTVLVLPWKQYFDSKKQFSFKLNDQTIASMFLLSVILIFMNIIWIFDEYNIHLLKGEIWSIIKQIIIIIFAIIIAMFWKTKRKITKAINLIETMTNILFAYYPTHENEDQNSESLSIKPLENQIYSKINRTHNQQTAIFIVFLVFILFAMTVFVITENA